MKIEEQDVISIINQERDKCYRQYEEIEKKELSWGTVAEKTEVTGKLIMLNTIQKRINEQLIEEVNKVLEG